MRDFLSAVLSFKPTYRMWSFLFMTIVVEIVLVVGTLMDWHLRQIPGLVAFTFITFLASFISHLSVTKTPKRLITLVIYFALTGFLIDAILINTEQFHFNIKAIYIFNTPVTQILTWFFMFYVVFSTTSSIGMLLNDGKVNYPTSSVFLHAFFDGFLLMGYSFMLEPMGVNEGSWTWTIDTPHQYYNVPYMVFFGFFLAIFVLAIPFRIFEAIRPIKKAPIPLHILLFPPIVFILLFILLMLNLMKLKLIVVAVIGLFIILSFLFIFSMALFTYQKFKKIG